MTDYLDQIVHGLEPSEPVTITRIKKLGSKFSLTYVGKNTGAQNTSILSKEELEALELITQEGQFNFSGNAEHFALFVEAERIHAAYQFDPLFAVNCSVVDPLPHQVEAVYKHLLPLPRIRFLLADDTGAGKTIMAGLLIKELMIRSLVERILIITPGGLTKQWQQDELQLKFNLNFRLVDRATFNSEPAIFSTADRLVTSIDFLRNPDVLNTASETQWDMIIVDEAHKLSAYTYGNRSYKSQRYEAIEAMASKCEHLLLLTATPHRGRTDTFRNLLQLLDQDIFSSDALVNERINELGKNGANKFFIRRLKEEMRDWDQKKLFKERFTRTTVYRLSEPEKKLYDAVTEYLIRRKEEAQQSNNIHVSLTLMVMQRRLTSSIYAIMRTLKNRYDALRGVLDIIQANPSLWKQRHRFETVEANDLDEYDELNDEEREQLDLVLSDSRKFKLFTTASNAQEIREEADEVKALHEMAKGLYDSQTEENKLTKLKELLASQEVLSGKEKLVIFTEHKDTMDYLEKMLATKGGYEVVTIHGGKSVDERRDAQIAFQGDAQILVATDAAGEGINLQFCRQLINWDIPWNPNRLEQRMGRIHRYGQKQDVIVFNMVAQNTREGAVLQRLLEKMDIIRDQLGDDRVFDVISDVFENVNLNQIKDAVFNNQKNELTEMLNQSDEQLSLQFKEKIAAQKQVMGHSSIDYASAKSLKERSDEKRLQPIYVRQFFERAFHNIGGRMRKLDGDIFRIEQLPPRVEKLLRREYNIGSDLKKIHYCFDKKVFLEANQSARWHSLHYINPGNPIFDAVLRVIREIYREEALKGTVMISPEDSKPHFAFLVKSKIADNRVAGSESLADARIALVAHYEDNELSQTDPAKFLDLSPPNHFAQEVTVPNPVSEDDVLSWTYEHITTGQFEEVKERVRLDTSERKSYLLQSFKNLTMDLNMEINDLQGQVLLGKRGKEEKLRQRQDALAGLAKKREHRLAQLDLMMQLRVREPEVLGCAYVVPLNAVTYKGTYGMSRDDETERIAMEAALEYERQQGRVPEDVGSQNLGYDIVSTDPALMKRYIEVKGRSGPEGRVMVSENEKHRLSQLGNKAWLYIVIKCKAGTPELYRIQDPGNTLQFTEVPKGTQFLLEMKEWQGHIAKSV